MTTSTVIRDWARTSGEFDGFVGNRGRLGPVIKEAYFSKHPREARQVAVEAGIEVGAKGRIKPETISLIANVLP